MKLVKHIIDYSESSNTLKDAEIILNKETINSDDLNTILEPEIDKYLGGIGQMAHKESFTTQLINSVLEGGNINLNGETYRIYP